MKQSLNLREELKLLVSEKSAHKII